MTTDRCPGCQAAVTPGAPWCTLCYADLRVPAATAPAPAPQPAPEPALAVAPEPVAAVALAPDPILDAPVMKAAPVAGLPVAGWPCLGCGSQVPLSDDVCGGCGRPFLIPDTMPSLSVPGIGDLRGMDRGQKILLTAVIGIVVTALFSAVAWLVGSVL